jgi:hypothetical protein
MFFLVAVLIAQLWDIRQMVNKGKQNKQAEEEKQRNKLNSVTPVDPTKQPQQQEQQQEEAVQVPSALAPSTSTSTVRKANSLELWVSRQKKLKRSLKIRASSSAGSSWWKTGDLRREGRHDVRSLHVPRVCV